MLMSKKTLLREGEVAAGRVEVAVAEAELVEKKKRPPPASETHDIVLAADDEVEANRRRKEAILFLSEV